VTPIVCADWSGLDRHRRLYAHADGGVGGLLRRVGVRLEVREM
jgi:hypothetical protein